MTTISINAISCFPENRSPHRLRIQNPFRIYSGVLVENDITFFIDLQYTLTYLFQFNDIG